MSALRNSLAICRCSVACHSWRHATGSGTRATPDTAGEPTSALGNIVKNATDEAREELQTENISISDGMHIQVNGHSIRRPRRQDQGRDHAGWATC